MKTIPKKRCPYCNSKKLNEIDESDDLECEICHNKWKKGLEWIHSGMKLWLDNISGCYSSLSNSKKKKYEKIVENFGRRFSSSHSVYQKDPTSSLMLLLNAMEELMEAFALVFHKLIPVAFSKSHEVKMTPFFYYSPELLKDKIKNKDEIFLYIDISGKYIRPLHLTESQFWEKEEKKEWNSQNERYGVMFRDGRYYRSDHWVKFCKDECMEIAKTLRYCGFLLDYIEKKDKFPGTFSFIPEGSIFLICSTNFLEDYWQKTYKKESKN